MTTQVGIQKSPRAFRLRAAGTLVLGIASMAVLFTVPPAQAQTFAVIHTFTGSDGAYPPTDWPWIAWEITTARPLTEAPTIKAPSSSYDRQTKTGCSIRSTTSPAGLMEMDLGGSL